MATITKLLFLVGLVLLVKGQQEQPSISDSNFLYINDEDNTYNGGKAGVYFPNLQLSEMTEVTIELWAYFDGFKFANGFPNGVILYCGDGLNYLYLNAWNGSYTVVNGNRLPTSSFVYSINGVENHFEYTTDEGFYYHYALNLRSDSAGLSSLNVIFQNPNTGAVTTVFSQTFSLGAEMSVFSNSKCIAGGWGENLSGTNTTAYGVTIISELAPFVGRIDEFRVWDRIRTNAQIQTQAFYSLVGDEANLTTYYRFDQSNGDTVEDSTANNNDARLVYEDVSKIPTYKPNDFSTEQVTKTGDLVPINFVNRKINYDQRFTGGVLQSNTLVTNALLADAPNYGKICVGVGAAVTNSCVGLAANDQTSAANVVFSYLTTRSACGKTDSFYFNLNFDNRASFAPVTFNVDIQPISPTLALRNYTISPNTGGNITILGNDFGLSGNLVSGEGVTLTLEDGRTITCDNPYVSSTRNSISCSLPAFSGSVGRGQLSVTLCGNELSETPYFRYNAPIVSYASVNTSLSNSTGAAVVFMFIYGSNFGPSRTFLPDSLNYVTLNGTTCEVLEINDTNIVCRLQYRFNDGIQYPLAINVGGQVFTYSFNYTLCGKPCQNNGTCIAFNLCNCLYTGFGGDDCTQPLICSPECKNGKCVESGTDATVNICQCDDNYGGADCSASLVITETETNVGLIAGLSSAGGVIILALVGAVIYLFFFRTPKRGTKNFIPLDKKDFAKIIYGEQLNQSPEKTNANLDELEKMLVQDDLHLAHVISSITQITEADQIAKAMVIIFQDNNKALSLLQAFIDEEVKNTESAGTLFRSNSMVSKMFKFYSRMLGLPYLYVTVGPELDEIITKQLGIEVDPEKMEEGADYDEMRWMLMAYSQKILVQILKSDEGCPVQFRTLFSHIRHVVGEKFAENVNTTIGGFIFLRFFCPAISSPEAYGILEEPPTPSSRRLLILITKVLQNLSNDVEFGSKEPYMAKMNDFIQSNRAKLAQFYEKLTKPTSKANTDVTLPPNMKKIQLTVLAHHIRTCLEQIEDKELRQKLNTIV